MLSSPRTGRRFDEGNPPPKKHPGVSFAILSVSVCSMGIFSGSSFSFTLKIFLDD